MTISVNFEMFRILSKTLELKVEREEDFSLIDKYSDHLIVKTNIRQPTRIVFINE